MRIIKVGAIQPGLIEIPSWYSCLSDDYVNDPVAIIENYVKRQLAVTTALLERAGRDGCEIVTTCEETAGISSYSMDVTGKNIFKRLVELSQPVIEAAFSEISRKYEMYIIGCYLAEKNEKIYNIASIFDRNGRITGEYRKTHLPANERWQCMPGDSLDVFELDFGKIGICICYDMMFPESAEVLALKGAEIIFHPTFGYNWYDAIGEATLKTRANDNGVYIVTSKNYSYNSAGKSSIIDFWGQVLADAGFYENVIVTKDIDLEVRKTQPDWYFNTHTTGIGDVTGRLRRERRPELYSVITEAAEGIEIPGHKDKLEILERIKTGKCRWLL